MFPILIKIGNLPVHTYGVLIATGFLIAVWVSSLEAKRIHINPTKIIDLEFWALLVGLIGSRILFIITQGSYFLDHPLEMISIWEGGLVFYGGPILCIPFFFWYTKRHQLPRWKTLDIAAMVVPLAHAFGRIGCLSAGCCYGKPTGSSWGIKLYSDLIEPALRGIYLHPTQLYESVSLFILFFFLFWKRKHKKFDGEIFYLYFIIYPIIRSIIEVFRGDSIRGFVIDNILSTSQFISILVVILAFIFYIKRLWNYPQPSRR